MKVLVRCGLVMVLVATTGWAAEEKKTDAQRNGLAGPVRAVSLREGETEFELNQKDWPVLVGIGECKECEYDRKGTLTRYGELVEGAFRGDRYQIVRDERGNVVEQVKLGADGEIAGRTAYGPNGIIEQSDYVGGARRFHAEWSYDSNGHLRELVQYDGDDQVQTLTLRQTDVSGNIKEEWCYQSKSSRSLITLPDFADLIWLSCCSERIDLRIPHSMKRKGSRS
jgi:hypothetical protein